MADQGTISVSGRMSGARTQEGKTSARGSKRPSPVLHCRIASPCWPKTWGCGPRESYPQKSGVRHYCTRSTVCVCHAALKKLQVVVAKSQADMLLQHMRVASLMDAEVKHVIPWLRVLLGVEI